MATTKLEGGPTSLYQKEIRASINQLVEDVNGLIDNAILSPRPILLHLNGIDTYIKVPKIQMSAGDSVSMTLFDLEADPDGNTGVIDSESTSSRSFVFISDDGKWNLSGYTLTVNGIAAVQDDIVKQGQMDIVATATMATNARFFGCRYTESSGFLKAALYDISVICQSSVDYPLGTGTWSVLGGWSGSTTIIGNPINADGINTVESSYREADQVQPQENHALLNYVEGQELVSASHSLPVCDLYRQSGISYPMRVAYTDADLLHPSLLAYQFIANLTTKFILENGGSTDLTGKTVGVLGGSFSVRPNSSGCKDLWISELGVVITDYGVGGAGFAAGGIPEQVSGAAVHDIYIIWCSTNDASNNFNIGAAKSQGATQSGGLNRTISGLRAKAPNCKILLFNSIKAYSQDYLYDGAVVRL